MSDERQAFLDAIKDHPSEGIHRWAFADWLEERGFDDEAAIHRNWTREAYDEAVAYVIMYAEACSGSGSDYDDDEDYRFREITVGEVMFAAHGVLDWNEDGSGDECWGGLDPIHLNFDTPGICYNREAFWKHFETITGIIVPGNKREEGFVSCSC